MFYSSRLPQTTVGPVRQNLLILIRHRTRLDSWAHPDLRAPYWRIYWNEYPGASIFHSGVEIPLLPDRIILIPPETSFASSNRAPVTHNYVHFLTAQRWNAAAPVLFSATSTDRKAFLALFQEPSNSTADWKTIAFTAEILGRLPPAGWMTTIDPEERVSRAIRIIEEHSPAIVPVTRLARTAGMTANSFVRLFREQTGTTPARFARERRLDLACLLLHHSSRTIDEIAVTCGFCDRYHFTRAFTTARRCSPAAFRRQARWT